MRRWLARLFGSGPALSMQDADSADAAAFSALHSAAFRRGWSDHEFERLLVQPSVVAHRACRDALVVGFILSRRAQHEAEILSVAVAPRERGRGVAGRLLALHIRSLGEFGVEQLFLEVAESNAAARRLYGRAGFRDVGKRTGYYGDAEQGTALVLRLDIV